MPSDGRLAAVASVGLFVAMFLPWYQITVRTESGLDSRSLTAFGDFSWIEAAVLVVAVGVLVLLFTRAEGRAFHLPGGDGTIIFAAGLWATALLVWRAFDKPTATAATAVGLKGGFVFAFASSGFLTWAGFRVRAAHRAEPPLPGEGVADGAVVGPPPPPGPPAPPPGRGGLPRGGAPRAQAAAARGGRGRRGRRRPAAAPRAARAHAGAGAGVA